MNKESLEKLKNFIPTVSIDLWPIPPSCILDLIKIAEHSLSSQDEVLTDEQIIKRAGEIFGFKPHKQDERTKARYIDFYKWSAGIDA